MNQAFVATKEHPLGIDTADHSLIIRSVDVGPDEVHDYVRCLLCGADDTVTLSETCRYNGTARTVLCRCCGLAYINPRRGGDAIRRYYQQQYRDQDGREYIAGAAYRRATTAFAGAIQKILRPDALILEVGCADGFLLSEIARLRPDCCCIGIEPDSQLAARGAAFANVKILPGYFEQMNFFTSQFDVIIFKHSLEHFSDPVAALRKARRLLKFTGVVYIELPDIWQPYGPLDEHFLQEAHLYTFSPRTLDILCRRCGLQPKIIYTDKVLAYLCYADAPLPAEAIDYAVAGDDAQALLAHLQAYRHNYSRQCVHARQPTLTPAG